MCCLKESDDAFLIQHINLLAPPHGGWSYFGFIHTSNFPSFFDPARNKKTPSQPTISNTSLFTQQLEMNQVWTPLHTHHKRSFLPVHCPPSCLWRKTTLIPIVCKRLSSTSSQGHRDVLAKVLTPCGNVSTGIGLT